MTQKKSWLKSRLEEKSTYVGIVVTVLVLIAGVFGMQWDAEILTQNIESIIAALAIIIAGVMSIYEAIRKEKPDED